MRQDNILLSKINRLIELIDESEEMFFEERKWLTDELYEPKIEYQDERRKEIAGRLQKLYISTSEGLAKKFPRKTLRGEQTGISGVAE